MFRTGLIIIIVALLFTTAASANTGELYGFGSRAGALGNTMLSGSGDGFATYYNPAANSALPGVHIAYGTAFLHPSFIDIENVVTENRATSLNPQTGEVNTSSYQNFFGQMIGISANLGEKVKNLTLGVTGTIPVERLALLDTGEPYKPEYFNYRSRTQRPQLYAALSTTPFSHFHFGTGLSFAVNLSASTNLYATTSSSGVSHQRFGSTMKPSVSPFFGAYTDLEPIQAGLVVRFPVKYKVSIDTDAKLGLFGDTGAGFRMISTSSSSVFYDPFEVDAAVGWKLNPRLWATLEANWLQYSTYEAPTLSIEDHGSDTKLMPSKSNLPEMRDIIVPKAGVQYAFDSWSARLGYYFRPSPVKDNSGSGNLVDPAQHVATAGVGINLQKAKLTDKELLVDLHGQYHYLVHQHISKSPENEAGSGADSKIGSPGYDIGGVVYGGGLSLSMSF